MKNKTYKIIGGVVILLIITVANNMRRTSAIKDNGEKYLAGYYDNTRVENGKVVPKKQTAYLPPSYWKNYEIYNAFTLSVPNSVELRKEFDAYTQEVKDISWHGYKINTRNLVFQQKGLSENKPEAFQTYCRIIINYEKEDSDEFFYKATEYEELRIEDIRYLQGLAIQECSATGFQVIGQPEVRWIRIEDIFAIETSYVRTGTEGNSTQVYKYWLFNGDETTSITLSYRKKNANIWEEDFKNVIRTFKWNKIKI